MVSIQFFRKAFGIPLVFIIMLCINMPSFAQDGLSSMDYSFREFNEDMPDLNFKKLDPIETDQLQTPNKWSFAGSVSESLQIEMTRIETKLSSIFNKASEAMGNYYSSQQQYEVLRAQYYQLIQQHASLMQQLQYNISSATAIQYKGAQLQQAYYQVQTYCYYGNQNACMQMQQIAMQYNTLLGQFNQLWQQYQIIITQLRNVISSGQQIEMGGVRVQQAAAASAQVYQNCISEANPLINKYQQLKMQTAVKIADQKNTGLDYNKIASKLKNNVSDFSNISTEAISQGIKAGIGTNVINDNELKSLGGNELSTVLTETSDIIKKTKALLKEVGILK